MLSYILGPIKSGCGVGVGDFKSGVGLLLVYYKDNCELSILNLDYLGPLEGTGQQGHIQKTQKRLISLQ